jgi:hypothetical protein
MTAASILADLRVAGITITRDGDNLRLRAAPGVALAPYLEVVRAHKPALLTALRGDPADALVSSLEQGWDWLTRHPHHPEYAAFEERWLARLCEYERAYAANHNTGDTQP